MHNLFRQLSIFIGLACLISCMHKSNTTPPSCITDRDIDSKKQSVVSLVQRLTEELEAPRWIAGERSCYKAIFNSSNVNLIIFKYPHTGEVRMKVSTGGLRDSATPECLNKALIEIESLEVPYTKSIVEKAKINYGITWEDSNIGAGSYLSCDDLDSASFYNSFDLFLHELNHFTTQTEKGKECSFFPWTNRTDCLKKGENFAVIDKLSTTNHFFNQLKLKQDIVKDVESTQKTYLGNAKEAKSPLVLIDELRSYSVGTEILEKVYVKFGKEKIYNKEKKRSSILPHLAVHALVIQLDSLNKMYPSKIKAYDSMICETLDKSDTIISSWLKTLETASDKAKITKIEKSIYGIFKQHHKNVKCN